MSELWNFNFPFDVNPCNDKTVIIHVYRLCENLWERNSSLLTYFISVLMPFSGGV